SQAKVGTAMSWYPDPEIAVASLEHDVTAAIDARAGTRHHLQASTATAEGVTTKVGNRVKIASVRLKRDVEVVIDARAGARLHSQVKVVARIIPDIAVVALVGSPLP